MTFTTQPIPDLPQYVSFIYMNVCTRQNLIYSKYVAFFLAAQKLLLVTINITIVNLQNQRIIYNYKSHNLF